MGGPLRRQALGDLEPVHGVHPREILGDLARLVSLQPADEMPGQLAPLQCFDLGEAFLQEILAEVLEAGARATVDCCAALTLRNGQKRDGIDTSGGRTASLRYASLSGLDAL